MGKRKEKMISQGSRRRQILQLDDDNNNNNHPYPSQTWQGYGNASRDLTSNEDVDPEEDKKVHHNPLSGLLSHYMDSDDEADDNQQEAKTSNGVKEESCSSESGKHNRIDMEVADFLKEIDALTTSEDMQTEEAESKDVAKNSSSNNGSDENSREASSSTDPTLVTKSPVEAWQQCFDEMTGYTYFWNTVSNQVTWDCPEDYSQYLEETKRKSLGHTSGSASQLQDYKTSLEDNSSKKESKSKSKKEPLSDEEGKIEPIRFYGPSSSNDESSSDDEDPDQQKHPKRQMIDTPSTSRDPLPSKEFGPSLMKEDNKTNPVNFTDDLSPAKIGPQLPPGFVLPGSDSPDLVNPRLTPELSIQTDPVVSPSTCKMEVLPNFDLSPPHTAVLSKVEASNAQENSGVDNDLNTHSQNKPEPEPNLACSGNSSPAAHQSPVVEFPLSQISCLEENEEPDSTTRVRSQKIETLNHPLPSNSEECIFVGQQNVPQVLPQMDDDSEEEHSCSAQPIISSSGASNFPPSFYEDDSNSDLPTRRGFGFKKQELPASNGGIDTSKRKTQFQNSINFVKAETLDLTELNRKVASNWNSGTKESMTPTDEGNDDNDIDEIDRELDLALERKKNQAVLNGAGTSASLSSSSSTSSTSSSSSLAMSSLSSPFSSHLPLKRLKTENGEESIERKSDQSTTSEEILSISSALFERLNSQGITEESISTLHGLYIQIKTRLDDWRNGALEPSYLLACLHHIDGELRQQESGASIPGWVCQWDRYEPFAFALYLQRLSLLFGIRCHLVLQQHKEKSGSQTKNKNELLVWNCNLILCLVRATVNIEFPMFGYDGGNKNNEKQKLL